MRVRHAGGCHGRLAARSLGVVDDTLRPSRRATLRPQPPSLPAAVMAKETRALVREAERQGGRVEVAGGGHLTLYAPDGKAS